MLVGILALQGDVAEHRAALADLGVGSRPVRRPEDLSGTDGLILPGGESTTMSMLLDSSGLAEPVAKELAAGLPAFGTCAGMILLARCISDGRPDQRSYGAIDLVVRRNGYGRQLESFELDLDLRLDADPDSGGSDSGGSDSGGSDSGGSDSRGFDSGGSDSRGSDSGGPDSSVTGPLHAIFIRAPVVESAGPGVTVLARIDRSSDVVEGGGLAGEDKGADGSSTAVVCRQSNVLVTAFHPELTADRRLHRLFVSMIESRR